MLLNGARLFSWVLDGLQAPSTQNASKSTGPDRSRYQVYQECYHSCQAKRRRCAEHGGVCFLTHPHPSKTGPGRVHKCVGQRVTSARHGLMLSLREGCARACGGTKDAEVRQPMVSNTQHGSRSWAAWQCLEQNFNLR